ncbi:MAG: diguanylate cyclase [Lachnospiraceae bacterium]|nr:diguanylate cyclase [Lachnospiraceae bacterium]
MDNKTLTDDKESTLKGLRIRTMSLWMVLGTILVSMLIGDGIINVMNRHRRLADITSDYIQTQNHVMNMSLGSNYLTEQARLYAITKESAHMEAYFTEVDETKRRENALQAIEEHLQGRDEAAFQMAVDALKLSNELMDLEIHAMTLAALSVKEDISQYDRRVQEYPLTQEELEYTQEQMADAARTLVFGQEYRDRKRQIEEKLAGVTEGITSICDQEKAESEKAMKNALLHQSFYTILVVALVIASYIMIAVLILRPIRLYVNGIKNNHFLDITGAYEFKYFAATYNNVYEMSLAQQNVLRQKAERDALTGLLNRQAFEQLKDQLSQAAKPLALLLIDVDVFKSINDTYGHEVGDQALINTANLLSRSFRTADYVMRIGGDEFAVIMEEMHEDRKGIIRDKISAINQSLQNPQTDLPKYSVSVGVAFSEEGYHDELFRQADQALYHTKENGRCGCTFYEKEINS